MSTYYRKQQSGEAMEDHDYHVIESGNKRERVMVWETGLLCIDPK